VLPGLALPDNTDAPPEAELTSIVDGVDASLLNRRGYLDITFQSPGDAPLDPASILDAAPEFAVTGSGVRDAVLSTVEHLEGNTFRFHFSDSDPDNETPLFDSGEIQIQFLASTWADTDGDLNTADTDEFTVRDGSADSSSPTSLG
ncbi:MAG: hypothetical protein ACK5YO_05015, partial [Planctomyces sp.]